YTLLHYNQVSTAWLLLRMSEEAVKSSLAWIPRAWTPRLWRVRTRSGSGLFGSRGLASSCLSTFASESPPELAGGRPWPLALRSVEVMEMRH
ncbi:unnamed protein product, partial [Rangifer tarandus platyrhynchus]